jgi:hypothetical protein
MSDIDTPRVRPFTVVSVTSPVYASADGSKIDCTVEFAGLERAIPFTANANDTTEHGRALHTRLVAGEFGTIAAYVAPPEPVPSSISVRQFWAGLYKVGRITKAQALAAIRSGTVPAAIQAYIDGLADAEAQFDAAVALSGQGTIQRDGALIAGIQARLTLTDAQVDTFFRTAGAL